MEMQAVNMKNVRFLLEIIIQLCEEPAGGVALLVATYVELAKQFRLDKPDREQLGQEIKEMVETSYEESCNEKHN